MQTLCKLAQMEFEVLVSTALVEKTEHYRRLNKKSDKPSEIDNKVTELITEVNMAISANEETHITKHGPTT